MLDVVARRLGRDDEPFGDRLVRLALGDQDQDFDFAPSQACRALATPRDAVPGGSEDGVDGVGVETAGCHLAAQLTRDGVRFARRPMRTRFGHRLIAVGGREQARLG